MIILIADIMPESHNNEYDIISDRYMKYRNSRRLKIIQHWD